ncbi:MAG: hypothetical protein U0X75_18320 [Acidobacteriota bacterium]
MANASPAADSLPALLVYDAETELISGQRFAMLCHTTVFYTGYKTSVGSPMR